MLFRSHFATQFELKNVEIFRLYSLYSTLWIITLHLSVSNINFKKCSCARNTVFFIKMSVLFVTVHWRNLVNYDFHIHEWMNLNSCSWCLVLIAAFWESSSWGYVHMLLNLDVCVIVKRLICFFFFFSYHYLVFISEATAAFSCINSAFSSVPLLTHRFLLRRNNYIRIYFFVCMFVSWLFLVWTSNNLRM